MRVPEDDTLGAGAQTLYQFDVRRGGIQKGLAVVERRTLQPGIGQHDRVGRLDQYTGMVDEGEGCAARVLHARDDMSATGGRW